MEFTYLGKVFKALRNFKDNESNQIYAHFGGYLDLSGYIYEDFYKEAKAIMLLRISIFVKEIK